MKRHRLLGITLIAVFAFSVVAAATASAVTFLLAEWLDNGVGLTSTLLSDTEGELTLRETVLGVKLEVLCSGIFDGTVGPNGEDEITELLALGGTVVDLTSLVEPGLTCVNIHNCPEALVWADNLPWKTLLELMEDGTESFFVDLLTNAPNNVGYHIDCMGSGVDELCRTAEIITKITNTAEGLDGDFFEAFTLLAALINLDCEISGIEAGVIEGLVFILLVEGGTLTASSEG